ncbi:thioredoxin family protein [uncultured Roseobacter sp.]|uniref:thioredoxin family protein n=1 Tax=uncultured Roseobacter sp. TaxID=114847 RepID=UPI002610442F|nr:thioredoxin family protein [uncultured Roseobacter sp.]
MSKSRKPQKRKSKTGTTNTKAMAEPSRRDMLKLLRNGGIGAVILTGGGYFGVGSYRAYAAEHDLGRLGQGKPVVVQVHDPQCPTCTALQKQTRKALKEFGECDLVYLIADINTPEGQAFAVRHGVGNVTLLLFDGEGGLRHTVQGMQSKDQLVPLFRGHHEMAG